MKAIILPYDFLQDPKQFMRRLLWWKPYYWLDLLVLERKCWSMPSAQKQEPTSSIYLLPTSLGNIQARVACKWCFTWFSRYHFVYFPAKLLEFIASFIAQMGNRMIVPSYRLWFQQVRHSYRIQRGANPNFKLPSCFQVFKTTCWQSVCHCRGCNAPWGIAYSSHIFHIYIYASCVLPQIWKAS